MIITRVLSMAAIAALFFASQAHAADPAVKCEAAKLKESAKYASCRLKAEAKGVQTATSPDFSKCEGKFTPKFTSLDTKFGMSVCPTEEDEASMNARITSDADDIAVLLSGGSVPECGNGVVEAGEDCDLGDLNGETCATQGLFGDGLACGAGCTFDTSGCFVSRYKDTGATIIDVATRLEWEKKTVGNVGSTYTLSVAAGSADTGTAYTVHLSSLNDCHMDGSAVLVVSGLGGHCDWRVPSFYELASIPKPIDPVFGPDAADYYWTEFSYSGNPSLAWQIHSTVGSSAFGFSRTTPRPVRAVRNADPADLVP